MPRLQAASELVDSGIALLPAFFSASRAAAGFARPWTATRRCLSRRRFSTATEETERTKDVVTTEWLEKSLGNPSLVVFDATWYPDPALTEADDRYWRRGYREALYGPIAVRDAWNHPSNRSHFEKHRIPGARFLDIDEMSDGLSRTPRKMPIPEDFAQRVTDMGISGSDHIIVYDGRGTLSAPRVHWLFKAFGHDKVSVLDGGLPKWLRERRAVETGTPQPNEKKAAADGSRYVAKRDQNVFLDYQRMWDNVLNNFIDPEAYQIVDARQPRVHSGELLDPIHSPKTARGHIPGSINIPYPLVLDNRGCLRDGGSLRTVAEEKRINLDGKIAVYSGSNVSAALVRLALIRAGADSSKVACFDGGWADWASKRDSPIKGRRTGPM